MNRLTDWPFPPYSYVTGHFPHPLRGPDGHGCAGPKEPTSAPTEDTWQDCEMYLWGIDLFNAGFYWEAHEAWEAVWHACNRTGPLANMLKVLIKFAAAGVKARENRPEGIRRHTSRAGELLKLLSTLNADKVLGMDLQRLVQDAEKIGNQADSLSLAASQNLSAPILPIRLVPAIES